MDHNRTDFRKTSDANRALMFRVAAIALVLYWLYDIVKAYQAGGPDTPSLTLLIVALVILGGGSLLLAIISYKAWKLAKENAEMTEEEIAEMEALRSGEEEE